MVCTFPKPTPTGAYTGKGRPMIDMLNTLPQNLDAEKKVLGAMMLDIEALHEARNILKTEDFYDLQHQTIFDVLCRMADHKTSIDLITLSDTLERDGSLKKIGGGFYLTELAQGVVTSANIDHHANIVKDHSKRRAAIRLCHECMEQAQKGDPPLNEFLPTYITKFNLIGNEKAGGLLPVQDSLNQVVDTIEQKYERLKHGSAVINGVSTGFNKLDRYTGGFAPGWLVILAGRPGQGKTSLGLQIGRHVSKEEHVLFYSLEMSREQLIERMIANQMGMNMREFSSNDDFIAFNRIKHQFKNSKFLIDDTTHSLERLEASARRFSYQNNIGLIIVDYLQLLTVAKKMGRYESVTECSRRLKLLANELKCPILVLSQLSRSIENREDKIPRLSDLRESGSIEQDADLVMFIYQETYDYQEHISQRILSYPKFRFGPTGKIDLTFEKEFTRFYETEETSQDDDEVPF